MSATFDTLGRNREELAVQDRTGARDARRHGEPSRLLPIAISGVISIVLVVLLMPPLRAFMEMSLVAGTSREYTLFTAIADQVETTVRAVLATPATATCTVDTTAPPAPECAEGSSPGLAQSGKTEGPAAKRDLAFHPLRPHLRSDVAPFDESRRFLTTGVATRALGQSESDMPLPRPRAIGRMLANTEKYPWGVPPVGAIRSGISQFHSELQVQYSDVNAGGPGQTHVAGRFPTSVDRNALARALESQPFNSVVHMRERAAPQRPVTDPAESLPGTGAGSGRASPEAIVRAIVRDYRGEPRLRFAEAGPQIGARHSARATREVRNPAQLSFGPPDPTQRAHVIARARAMDLPISLVDAVVSQESGWRSDRIGPRGEVGLFQIDQAMVEIAGFSSQQDDWHDVTFNTEVGLTILRKALEKAKGDWLHAAGLYDAGLFAKHVRADYVRAVHGRLMELEN